MTAPFPEFVPPQLATLKDRLPEDDGWVHEIKFDGYRVQGHVRGGKATLITRGGHDWTARMSAVAVALAKVPANNLVVDGEVIVPDRNGASDFDALEEVMGSGRRSGELLYYLFDLLYLDGFDVRAAPLVERKRVLRELLRNVGPPILYSDHLEGHGQQMFENACVMGLEGIVSKRAEARYRSGRSEAWLKAKCATRGTFTVVGYVPEGKGLIAALHLARKEKAGLRYVGKVGTGWSMRQSAALRVRLEALELDKPPVAVPGKRPKAVWVRPTMKAEVVYRAVTAAGLLRSAVWKR